MIVRSTPPAKPEAASCPPEAAPLPSAPARSVAPWRVAAVAGLLVLTFFVRPLGWGAVLVLAWIAASEFVALIHGMRASSRAVHEGGPPEVRES